MSRSKLVFFFVVTLLSILVTYVLFLSLVRGKKYRALSKKNCIRLLPQDGCRGRLLDRNGDILVDSELCYDVMVMPGDSLQLQSTLQAIAHVLGVKPDELFATFRRNVTYSFSPVCVAKAIEVKEAIALEELKTDFPGIFIQPRPQRRYDSEVTAAHVIGHLGEIDRWRLTRLEDYGYKTRDIVGFGGIEERYDYYLRQEEGGGSVEVDHQGRFVRLLGVRPPQNGKDIQLTLNKKIQKIVEAQLGDREGAVVILDPMTGEIIALASAPPYAPSVFVKKSNSEIRALLRNPQSPFLNRAISGVYPPGSVFKPVVAAAALETNKINRSKQFFCSGGTTIGNRKFACWDTHHEENIIDALSHSCDVFFYKTGLLVGANTIHDYAVKFGFSRATNVDIPSEENGFVPSPLWKTMYKFQNWYDGDTANFSIGQGDLLVTPLQVARMMAVFANGGWLVHPYLVKSIDGKDMTVYQRKGSSLGLKQSTMDIIREGLRRAVFEQEGTAHVLSELSVSVAGKTGTAQAPPGLSHGWFVGFFPYKAPQFVICTFLEHGGSGHAASVITKNIIEQMLKENLIQSSRGGL